MSENTIATVLAPQREGIPLPEPTVLSQPFWDGCVVGELRYQRCTACGRAEFDPNKLCRGCGADTLDWQVSAGRGTVYSYTEVTRPQTPAFTSPYVVVIVELDEGYHMVSNIIGCVPADVRIGLPVAVEFHEIEHGVVLPYFAPAAGEVKA
ncbi:Zn-ribbon domain-containing OB-fold protein [Nocardiaceae bacterium NPDC056970]